MRSGTSFCNATIYKKDLQRFWPLWGLYLLIWLVLMPVRVLTTRAYGDSTLTQAVTQALSDTPSLFQAGALISFFFAVMAAMAVFGYLYSPRSACMIHSLPLRRESLFLTNYLSGLTFLVGPLVLVFGLTVAAAACRGVFDPWPLVAWLGMQLSAAIFFYSFAVFCAMFTGHILALPAFYFILNFLALGLFTLVSGLCSIFLYGYTRPPYWARWSVAWLTPISQIVDGQFWDGGRVMNVHILAIYTGLGLVLALLALSVYRRRHVESAGDVVAVAVVRPIFRAGVAFCSGVTLGIFTCEVLDLYHQGGLELPLLLCMLIWTVAGWYIAEMLLQKSFRVLRRGMKGAAGMVVVMLVLYLGLSLDLTGFERYVPPQDEIQSVALNLPNNYPDRASNSLTVTDPDQLAKVLALHQAVADAGEGPEDQPCDDRTFLRLDYTMKDGTQCARAYYGLPLLRDQLETQGTVTWAAQQLLDDRALSEQALRLDHPQEDDYVAISVEQLWDPQTQDFLYANVSLADSARLMQALRADFQSGALGQRYLFYPESQQSQPYLTNLILEWRVPLLPTEETSSDPVISGTQNDRYSYYSSTIPLTAGATHTLALLREVDVLNDRAAPIDQADYDAAMTADYPATHRG